MPFKSQAQRSFMYLKHPKVAKEWAKKYGPQKDLPAKADQEEKKSPWVDMKSKKKEEV